MMNRVFEADPCAPVYVYCSADIIFPPYFAYTLLFLKKKFQNFMATGRRVTIKMEKRVNFEDENWWKLLQRRVSIERTHADNPHAIDFFAYTASFFGDLQKIPPLLIGRPYFDLWVLGYARRSGKPVIDLSAEILTIHQYHDYSYLRGGSWPTKESEYNKKTARQNGGIGRDLDQIPLVLICNEENCDIHTRSEVGKRKRLFAVRSRLLKMFKKLNTTIKI
eukprot:NODE_6889_length_832_cov_24.689704_g6289_i0.p1 GENE.NODE_6889_length_832_cov_24.689704_g6289_i0~~NODE_6889_length_832_cov_24.689704_g6289_i0.p1  ORF type:complete len:249 (+),score=41.65 NODE_6889_length_832_cov_24.689704_g6289_i0:86-748(+)